MTANGATKRRRPPTRRRDEIEAIGLALGVLWVLLVLVTTLGGSPGF